MNFKRRYINLRGQKIWAAQAKPLFGALYGALFGALFGAKESVLLLHGGMSQSEGFDNRLLPSVKGFRAYSYDRAGHGRTADQPGSFHFEFQFKEAVAYLEDVVKEPAHLIGYSDGGIISLLLAIKRPDLVKTISLIGANYSHGGATIDVWVPTDADRAKYAAFSPDAPETLDEKIRKMAHIWSTEPNLELDDLAKIKCPTLVIAGDDDVIDLNHTNEIYLAIKNARLAIIPGASHAIHKDQTKLLNQTIRQFLLNQEYPVTAQPVRRKLNEAL